MCKVFFSSPPGYNESHELRGLSSHMETKHVAKLNLWWALFSETAQPNCPTFTCSITWFLARHFNKFFNQLHNSSQTQISYWTLFYKEVFWGVTGHIMTQSFSPFVFLLMERQKDSYSYLKAQYTLWPDMTQWNYSVSTELSSNQTFTN